MRKFSFFLIALFLFTLSSRVFAYGTPKYIIVGQAPTIAWSIGGGTTSCSPDTTYTNNTDGVRSTWLSAGTTAVGSTVFPSVTTNSGSPFTFLCSANGVSDQTQLYVYPVPTLTGSCTPNGGTYSLTVTWPSANSNYLANSSGVTYPQRIQGPGAPTSAGAYSFYSAGGGAYAADNVTGTSITWSGLTAGNYSIWGHVYDPKNGWSSSYTIPGGVNCATAATYPDLTAGGISPTTAFVGTAINLAATISTNGATSTGTGFYNLFQYATDSNGTGATDLGTYNRTTPLTSGSFNATLNYTPTTPGTFYVRACADKSSGTNTGTIMESNENNNCGAWTAITVAVTEPTFSANCTLQGNGTYNIAMSWNSVSGATNYPVRIQGPSHATGDTSPTGSYPIGTAGGADVIGWGTVGDAPTGTTLTWTGITTSGNYSYWGHAWNSNPSPGGTWSSNTVRTVTCPVPGAATASINQSTSNTTPGTPFTVSWASSGATSCTVTYTGPTSGTVGSGTSGGPTSVTLSTTGTYTFTNTCTNASATASMTHTVGSSGNCSSATQSWSSCSGTIAAGTNGSPQTVTNTAANYSGSATYMCNSGAWTGPSSSSCLCDDSTADNFGGAAPCTYTSPTINVNVRATSPITAQPSSTTTETFTSSSSDGADTACRLVNSTGGNISGYSYVGGSPTSVVIKGITVPATEGEYTFGIKCRDTASTTVTGTDYFLLDVCADLSKVWDSTQNKCVYPPDLTAGDITPTTTTVGTNTTFSGTLYNIGEKAAVKFDYFFQKATGSQGTGTLSNGPSGTYNGTLNGGGQSIIVNKTISYNSAGTYSLRLCADKKNQNDTGKITESNENNNCGAWTDICVGTAAQCSSAPPQVVNPTVVNNNTPSGSLQFSCLNSSVYRIIRSEGPSGIYPTASTTYSAQVNSPVTVAGSYQLICANSTTYDSVVVSYNPASLAPVMSLTGTPRTIEAGSKVTLSWSITNPNTSCKITATPVCAGTCSAAQTDAAAALTSSLSTGTTDSNDPNGASRLMSSALQTVAPTSSTKALGKKTIQVNYTTDFGLSCGTSTATSSVRVLVSTNTEG